MTDDQDVSLLTDYGSLKSEIYHQPKIQAINLTEFLNKKLAPREYLLAPWLPRAGLCMVYAARGVGKTFFCA
ncbi:MAG: AAA family ATPase [Silvanigrellaceae bacterium]|nr:AAA family ATPase [Silvanigrellaceae bacterium]